ncbi:uncharacterized protein LOC135811312 [Sycon ciliatum]|uniref:uncharacterized protein LOC135811312 n=1 Tax=Sycon ciliatum TaxID=27933 RepID=UPI0031F69793
MECGGLPSGGGNEFGKAFHQAAPATRWADICNDDSDEDGFTNGAELGDPQCIWTEGGTPTSTSGLSHPGMNCSIPTDPFCRNTGNTPAPISIPSESPTSNSTATSNTTGNTTGDNGSGQLALAATHSLAWLPPLILAAIFLM